jgi:hypothetical protein
LVLEFIRYLYVYICHKGGVENGATIANVLRFTGIKQSKLKIVKISEAY